MSFPSRRVCFSLFFTVLNVGCAGAVVASPDDDAVQPSAGLHASPYDLSEDEEDEEHEKDEEDQDTLLTDEALPDPGVQTEPAEPTHPSEQTPVAQTACPLPAGELSFAQLKGPESQLPVACAPVWTRQQLASGFAAIRDARWLTWPEMPGFERRIPWLSVQTGCEERAPMALYYLAQQGFPTPYYVRARGDLGLRTDNDPAGKVSWSAHVAPVVRLDGQLLVLDPALDPRRPLPVSEWLDLFSKPTSRDVALCRDHASEQGCFDATPAPLEEPGWPIHLRLGEEWRVQELLGRDPYRSLGECPPWTTCLTPEPTADASRAPVIKRFASDQNTDDVGYPLYIVGDNFSCDVISVKLTREGVHTYPRIGDCKLRRILLDGELEVGTYQVTVSNGRWESAPAELLKSW